MDRSSLTPADREFIESFESCAIAPGDWNHRCHIRMAWIYLRTLPYDAAVTAVRDSVQRYARTHKVPADVLDRGYHETVTVAWMQLVASAMRHHEVVGCSEAFCEAMPHLVCRTLLRVFYSRERITSWEAKAGFVSPDITALPDPGY